MFCVLALSEDGKLVSISNGDLSGTLDHPPNTAPIIVVDLMCRCIAFVYDGPLTFAAINTSGPVSVFDGGIDVSRAIDVTFIDNQRQIPVQHLFCSLCGLI